MPPSILLWAGAALALLSAFAFFPKRLEFSSGFPAPIAAAVTASASAFTTLGVGDIHLDGSSFDFGFVQGLDNGFTLVGFCDEDKSKPFGFTPGPVAKITSFTVACSATMLCNCSAVAVNGRLPM